MAAAGIIVVGGKILTVGGNVAVDQACCCDAEPPPPPEDQDCPPDCSLCCKIITFTFSGGDINGATVTFTNTAGVGEACNYQFTSSTGGITDASTLICSGKAQWTLDVATADHTYLFTSIQSAGGCPALAWQDWRTSNGARVRKGICGCLTDCSVCNCVYSAAMSGTGNATWDTEVPVYLPEGFPSCQWNSSDTGDYAIGWILYCVGERKWRLRFRPWNYNITGSTDYVEFEEDALADGCPPTIYENVIHNSIGGSPAAVLDIRACACPTDCTPCSDTLIVTVGGTSPWAGSYAYTRSGCDWTHSGVDGSGAISCSGGVWTWEHDFPDDPPKPMCSITATHNQDTSGCPPEGEWTVTIDATCGGSATVHVSSP